jgi:hypothetical protein
MHRLNNYSISALARRLAGREWFFILTAALAVFTFYYLTAAGNLSETDDVYSFAYKAEHSSWSQVSDPRLMLYHMAMRVIYLAGSSIKPDISALALTRLFSAVCAPIALILFIRILILDLKLSDFTAGAASFLLGSTYGFWRYAVEGDVYVFSIMLCLLIFHLLSQSLPDSKAASNLIKVKFVFTAIGVLAGISVLFYQPNAIPLFFAFPLLLLAKDRRTLLSCYLVSGAVIVMAGYLIGYSLYRSEPLSVHNYIAFILQRSEEFDIPPLSLRTVVISILRSCFSLSHDIASSNWIFGFTPVVQLIHRVFPANSIIEEIFLTKSMGWIIFLPVITLVLLVFFSIRLAVAARSISLKGIFNLRTSAILIWFILNSVIIGRLNPAGIEAWIVVLPPLVILFAVIIIEFCAEKQRKSPVLAVVLMVFIHNTVGGMGLVHSPAYEYERVKGAWIIHHADERDLVIVTDNARFAQTLEYLSKSRIVTIPSSTASGLAERLVSGHLPAAQSANNDAVYRKLNIEKRISETRTEDGRIILFEEFFEAASRLTDISAEKQTALGQLRTRMEEVHHAPEVGSTFAINANSLP